MKSLIYLIQALCIFILCFSCTRDPENTSDVLSLSVDVKDITYHSVLIEGRVYSPRSQSEAVVQALTAGKEVISKTVPTKLGGFFSILLDDLEAGSDY